MRAESAGILTWMVQGCASGNSTACRTRREVLTATKDYQVEQDLLGAFLTERCTEFPDYHIKASELYGAYKA